MTYDEITLFRRFLQDKGMLSNYEYFYQSHRLSQRSLDTFLEQVDADDAILSAFDLSAAPNTIFTVKYWQQLNDKWYKRLYEYRKDGAMPDQPKVTCTRCGRLLPVTSFAMNAKCQLHKQCKDCESGEMVKCAHCGRLLPRHAFAMNGKSQLHKHCRECESGEWDRKRRLEERLDDAIGGHDNHAPMPPEAEENPAPEKKASRPLSASQLTAPKLGEYDATLHYKSNQKSVTLNAVLSEQIQKAQMTHCYLNTDRSHRMFLVFNRVDGANVTQAGSPKSMLLQVCSADICRSLAVRFNLESGDNYYLHITRNTARTEDLITIEVLAVRTREEYVRIAQRRKNGEPDAGQEETRRVEPAVVHETPVVEIPEPPKEPLLNFCDITDDATPNGRAVSPDAILQKAVDDGILSERDIAAFLYHKGWELHEPVVVTKHKKFSL